MPIDCLRPPARASAHTSLAALLLLAACGDADGTSGSTATTGPTSGTPSTGDVGPTSTATASTATGATDTTGTPGTTGPTSTTDPDPDETCRELTPGWTGEIVDDNCAYVSLAVDADGAAHVVFVKGSDAAGTATAHYATNKSGSFVTTTIDAEAGRVRSTAIAVDADGHAHVSFDKITGSTVRYATDASGSWVLEEVTSVPVGGADSTLALDAAGRPHISYRGGQGDLYLATRPTDMWILELVSATGAQNSSLWVDPGGEVHVAFGDYYQDELFVATNSGGAWSEVTLGAGERAALVRAGDGNLHATFIRGAGPFELVHAVETSPGSWTTEAPLDTTTKYQFSTPSSAVGPDGAIHVAYEVAHVILDGCGVHLARRAQGAAEFTVERVVEDGRDPSLAVDATGVRHIAYCDIDGLMYAREPG